LKQRRPTGKHTSRKDFGGRLCFNKGTTGKTVIWPIWLVQDAMGRQTALRLFAFPYLLNLF
jgi:hypothetical protein